jgi:glycosyltransferase involved in cell wall biosynthesis
MNNPLVSIIIPTYNRADLIGETLDSIKNQTYQNWECIIVDDGSTDHTDEVVGVYVNKDARFKYFQRPDDHLSGGNGARNYGFILSQGEYIQWFDSDDLMKKNKLTLQVNDLVTYNLDVSFSGFEILKTNGTVIKEPLSLINDFENLFEAIVTKKVKINTLSPVFKKAFLLKGNLFDENLLTAHELEFYTRIFYKKDISYRGNSQILSTVRQASPNSIILKQNSLDYDVVRSLLNVRRSIQIKSKNLLDRESFEDVTRIYLKLLLTLKRNSFSQKLILKEIIFLLMNSNFKNLGLILNTAITNKLFF